MNKVEENIQIRTLRTFVEGVQVAGASEPYKYVQFDKKDAEELLDYINKLEREIKIKDAWANEIKCDLWGYDGCENSIPGLRGLVDEAIDKSEKIMNCDDKSIVISGFKHDEYGNRYAEHRNVLDEVLTEFTEEDQKIINLFGGDE